MNFSESERLQQLSNEYILGGVNPLLVLIKL